MQDKMIDLFTQCDAEYGRRVAEGLKQPVAESANGMGNEKAHEAVEEAEQMSHEAKQY